MGGAYAIVLMVQKDPGSASIGEADSMVRRSIRLVERGTEGDCKLSEEKLSLLAQCYDTLRAVEEVQGHTDAALGAARSALELLPAKDRPQFQEPFSGHVERLEAQAAAAR